MRQVKAIELVVMSERRMHYRRPYSSGRDRFVGALLPQ